MKTIKWILISVIVLVALVLIVAMFAKKDYSVERQIEISKNDSIVFAYLVLLKNQDQYSVWANMDTSMKKEYRGIDGTVGFVSAWESTDKNVGKGEQEIIAIEPGKRIDYELRFMEPFESKDQAFMAITPIDSNRTEVTWGISGRMKYPMNLMMVFMDMEGMIAKDFDLGLKNLKQILE